MIVMALLSVGFIGYLGATHDDEGIRRRRRPTVTRRAELTVQQAEVKRLQAETRWLDTQSHLNRVEARRVAEVRREEAYQKHLDDKFGGFDDMYEKRFGRRPLNTRRGQ
jgi:hypothetical protein